MKKNPSQLCVVWRIVTVFLFMNGKCTETCPTVQQTAQQVQRCPMNETEWKNAAMNKKCGELHRNCTPPTRFEYHCALNVFLNETWEVCAPGRYLLGHCLEYNGLGNRIQDNYRRNCSAMNPPCPSRYNSTEAYRYQKCYQTVNYRTSTPNGTHITIDTKEETDNGNTSWIAVLYFCIVISILVITCICKAYM